MGKQLRPSASLLALAAMLFGCGQDSAPASADICSAREFGGATTKSMAERFRDCGTRTMTEADAILAEYPSSGEFLRQGGSGEATALASGDEKLDVMVCNLSPNRGVVEVPEQPPTTRIVIGRSCLSFEDVSRVGVLGGRLASEPEGDGQGAGAEEWFGLYFTKPATP